MQVAPSCCDTLFKTDDRSQPSELPHEKPTERLFGRTKSFAESRIEDGDQLKAEGCLKFPVAPFYTLPADALLLQIMAAFL